jgi:hypothetical protein
MIYILDAVGADVIKIGYTEQRVEKRIAALQTGCPHKLVLLAVMAGELEDERELHQMAERWRIPWTREWFRKASELMNGLVSLGAGIKKCIQCGTIGANIDGDPPTGAWVCVECHTRKPRILNLDLIERRHC